MPLIDGGGAALNQGRDMQCLVRDHSQQSRFTLLVDCLPGEVAEVEDRDVSLMPTLPPAS